MFYRNQNILGLRLKKNNFMSLTYRPTSAIYQVAEIGLIYIIASLKNAAYESSPHVVEQTRVLENQYYKQFQQ